MSSGHPGFHGAHRNAEVLSDLDVGHAERACGLHDLTFLGRKFVDGLTHLEHLPRAVERHRGDGDVGFGLVPALCWPHLAPANVDGGSSCDRIQPWRQVPAFFERGRSTPRLDEGLLHDLGDQLVVLEHGARHRADGSAIAPIHGAHSVFVSLAEASHIVS